MAEYLIEAGSPPDAHRSPSGRRTSYPWSSLQAGQTVFLSGRKMGDGLASSLSRWRQAHPEQIILSRSMVENGVEGVRVWRTA